MGDRVEIKGPSVGLSTLLAVVFVTLKLLGKIDWSWWWVLAPIWIPWAVLAIIGVVVFVLYLMFGKRRW